MANKGDSRKTARIYVLCILMAVGFMLSGCGDGSASSAEAEELDVRGTLDALGHPDSDEEAGSNPMPMDTPAPEPTASPTVYVPEGQLYYTNFEDVAEGMENEQRPGIFVRKAPFGIEIELDVQTDYFLKIGLSGVSDANISTYVLNMSAADKTSAFLACRVKSETGENGEESASQGYIASFRFDGATRLVRKMNNTDSVLVDWQKNITLNPDGIYNQLYLLCEGERILFMVNAQVAFDVSDSQLSDGDFAIGVSNQTPDFASIVRFDKVAVFEP